MNALINLLLRTGIFYAIFGVLSDTCWRRRRCGIFTSFQAACRAADKCAASDLTEIDVAVARHRDGEVLYVARRKTKGGEIEKQRINKNNIAKRFSEWAYSIEGKERISQDAEAANTFTDLFSNRTRIHRSNLK